MAGCQSQGNATSRFRNRPCWQSFSFSFENADIALVAKHGADLAGYCQPEMIGTSGNSVLRRCPVGGEGGDAGL